MSLLILITKSILVAFFLVMFLRSAKPVWGIGLLTVTSAILLDTFLGTFGRDEMLEELGFFYYVIAGALFAGATVWLWVMLRPVVTGATRKTTKDSTPAEQNDTMPGSGETLS